MSTNIQKILFAITGAGWLVVFSAFLFPIHTFEEGFWGIMAWAMIGLSCVSVAVSLITRQKNKEIWLRQSVSKKIVSFVGILLSIAVTAVVAFVVMLIISMSRDPHPLS